MLEQHVSRYETGVGWRPYSDTQTSRDQRG
jgi:hypothetical protein